MRKLKEFFLDEPIEDLIDELIDEKSVSKSQQRFMGMVHAVQRGEMEPPSPEVAKAASSMKKKDAKDFAKTKHKGLPDKVKTEAKRKTTKKTKEPQFSKEEMLKKVNELLAKIKVSKLKGNNSEAMKYDKELAVIQRKLRTIKESIMTELATDSRILKGIEISASRDLDKLIQKIMKDLKLSKSVAIIALEKYLDIISKSNSMNLNVDKSVKKFWGDK